MCQKTGTPVAKITTIAEIDKLYYTNIKTLNIMNANEENNLPYIEKWRKEMIQLHLNSNLHPAIRDTMYIYFPILKDFESCELTYPEWDKLHKVTSLIFSININLVLHSRAGTINHWNPPPPKIDPAEKAEADEELNEILIRVFQFPNGKK